MPELIFPLALTTTLTEKPVLEPGTSEPMKPMRLALAVLAVAALAGCSGSTRFAPHSGDEFRTLAQDGATAAESIAAADLLYREALAHYVTDALDEARPLLRRALAELGDAHPDDPVLRSEKSSLTSRVEYFLAAVEGHGAEAEPFSTESARIDTVPLALLESATPGPACGPSSPISSRKYSATAVATYADLRRTSEGWSDVATTSIRAGSA